MAAVGRVKGGGDRQARSRVLFVAVGCFLFFLVCLLSSRPDAAVVLAHARAGAVRPLQGGSHGHRQQSAEQSNGMADTERVSDAVIGGETNGDVERDAAPEPAERESSAAAAATPNSGEQAEPDYPLAAAADADQDKSLQTPEQAAVRTTSPRHQLPGEITTRADPVAQRPLCDTSDRRADVCDLAGDVRMVANASAFVVVGGWNGPETYRVRPYARKGDAASMGRVTEIAVRAAAAAPRCTAAHAEPAVVFSIGGYAGNLFHDFTDVHVPLFNAAQRYRGEVRLVVADAAPRWLANYGALLRGLSRHAPRAARPRRRRRRQRGALLPPRRGRPARAPGAHDRPRPQPGRGRDAGLHAVPPRRALAAPERAGAPRRRHRQEAPPACHLPPWHPAAPEHRRRGPRRGGGRLRGRRGRAGGRGHGQRRRGGGAADQLVRRHGGRARRGPDEHGVPAAGGGDGADCAVGRAAVARADGLRRPGGGDGAQVYPVRDRRP